MSRRSSRRLRAGVLLAAGAIGVSACAGHSDRRLTDEPRFFAVGSGGRGLRALARPPGYGPGASPDGRWTAVTATTPESSTLAVEHPDGSGRRVLLRGRSPIPPAFAWAPDGRRLAVLAFDESALVARLQIVAIRGGPPRTLDVFAEDSPEGVPSYSPDGRLIAYARRFATRSTAASTLDSSPLDIAVIGPDGRRRSRLTHGRRDSREPQFAPDDNRILYAGDTGDAVFRLAVTDPRSRRASPPLAPALIIAQAAWSPDGRSVAFSGVTLRGDRRTHLYVLDVATRAVRRLAGSASQAPPAWSPDGRLIAYATEQDSIAVRAAADGPARSIARLPGGDLSDVTWSPDGTHITFSAQRHHRET